MDGDQEISKEGGEHGKLGYNLIPLLGRHVDTTGQEGDEGGGGTKDRGLGGCGNDGPELVQEVWSECQSVEQAIPMQGLGIVQSIKWFTKSLLFRISMLCSIRYLGSFISRSMSVTL